MSRYQPINDGQRFALNKLVNQFADCREARLYVLSALTGRPLASSSAVTVGEWRRIRDEAYPNWPDDDWTVAEAFAAKVFALVNRYREEVCGQLRLF
jgi:hypothetical protein